MIKGDNETLLNFYASILNYMKLCVTDDTSVIESISGDLPEFTDKDDNNYLLPYKKNLRNPNGHRIFHPLNESYTKPDSSPCLKAIRTWLEIQLNLDLSALIVAMINVAMNQEASSKITKSSVIDLFSHFKGLDAKFIDTAIDIIKEGQIQTSGKHIISLYVRKNGEIGDTEYLATGRVSFPLREALVASEDQPASDIRVYGVKCRRMDVSNLLAIHDYLFPDADNIETYQDGSQSTVFRYFDTYLRLSYLITQQINRACKEFKSIKIKEIKTLFNNLSYDHAIFNELSEIYEMGDDIRDIPNQDPVVGHKKPTTEKLGFQATNQEAPVERQPEQTTQHHQSQSAQHHQPVPQTQMQPTDSDEAMDPLEFLRGGGGQQLIQPQMQGYWPNPSMGNSNNFGMGMPQQQLPQWARTEMMQNQLNPQYSQPSPYGQVNQFGQAVDAFGNPIQQNNWIQPFQRSTFG